MKAEYRKRLFHALMGDAYEIHDEHIVSALAHLAERDLDAIEPIIDEMLADARAEGRKANGG